MNPTDQRRQVIIARLMLASAIASTIAAACLLAALALMVWADDTPEPCHAPPVPACAEMGTCARPLHGTRTTQENPR